MSLSDCPVDVVADPSKTTRSFVAVESSLKSSDVADNIRYQLAFRFVQAVCTPYAPYREIRL